VSTFDIPVDPRLGNATPIISVTRAPVTRSEDAAGFTESQRARWAGRRDFRGDKVPEFRAPEVVMRNPAPRPLISNEQHLLNEANRRRANEAKAAPQVNDSEAVSALRVELAAVRELLAHVVARLDALDGALEAA
jgi:hypothetical protein